MVKLNIIKEALLKKLEGDIEVAETDLRIFLTKPVGVAEHIDYVATAEKKLEALSNARDKHSTLKWVHVSELVKNEV